MESIKKKYLSQFCKDVCGECRLPMPEKCYWKEIMSQAWDASHRAVLENVKAYLDSHQLTTINGDTYEDMQSFINNKRQDLRKALEK